MSKVMQTLQQEHSNLSQLLDLLNSQIEIFGHGGQPAAGAAATFVYPT